MFHLKTPLSIVYTACPVYGYVCCLIGMFASEVPQIMINHDRVHIAVDHCWIGSQHSFGFFTYLLKFVYQHLFVYYKSDLNTCSVKSNVKSLGYEYTN